MKRHSVLVVEDDVVLCMAMGTALSHRGYDTRTAHSVADGIGLASEQLPELVILDISLPDGLGWSVLDGIRSVHPDSELSVVVATSDRITRSQLREYQVQRYISKPYDVSHMLETVLELLPLDEPCHQEEEPVR
jgi:two-component system response regulator RegA